MASHSVFFKHAKKNGGFSMQNGDTAKDKEKSALAIIEGDALRHKKLIYAIVAALFLAILFIYSSDIKRFLVIIAFIALGSISRLWQRFLPLSIGVNFIMLVTVCAGVLYSPFAGLVVGVLTMFFSAIIVLDEPATMISSFFAIAVVGYISGYVPLAYISIGGLLLTVLYDAILFISFFLFGAGSARTIIFVATHIVFNYFVFYNIAPALVNALV